MTPFHIKPRCTFKILLNIVLLVTISNIFKLEHKMNSICQCCLRPEKNLTLMVGISPTSVFWEVGWKHRIGRKLKTSQSGSSFYDSDQVMEISLASASSFVLRKINNFINSTVFRLRCFSLKCYDVKNKGTSLVSSSYTRPIWEGFL